MAELNESELLPLEACVSRDVAGGKAVGLARLLRGGLPVPPGFVIPCSAFRAARQVAAGGELTVPGDLATSCVAEWRNRGAAMVAVRSSATVEDSAGQSMAGQFATVVGVEDEASLTAGIETCWRSLPAGADESAAMAVIVQQVVAADVAGVVFTADPDTGHELTFVLEASWGLGEAVVAGHVQPDRWRIDSGTGEITQRDISSKDCWIPPGGKDPVDVAEERRRIPCLNDAQLETVRELALAATDLAGRPQDVEFALDGDRVWLLQSRDITTLRAARARSTVLINLGDISLDREGGPWIAHNLGETLRQPTPFTWSVMRRFMSGDGGFGQLYRRVGFAPSPRITEAGFLELIGGRIYADIVRAPEVFFDDYPYAYDLELLRRDPGAGQLPPSVPTGSARRLRAIQRRLGAVTANLRRLAGEHHRRLAERLVPEFVAWCEQEAARGLDGVDDDGWHEVWTQREARVHDGFAPESLLPSLIVGLAVADLRELLGEFCWREDRRELLNQLVATPRPDLTMQAVAGLHRLAQGDGDLGEWMRSYGHRAPDEMDLATPRWRETPEAVDAMIARLADEQDPLEQHRRQYEHCAMRVEELRTRLGDGARAELDAILETLHRYLHWREDGKHALLRGTDLLRHTALDAGRRLGIGEDVFLLTPDEVRTALAGSDTPAEKIEERREERRTEAELNLPRYVDHLILIRAGYDGLASSLGPRMPAFPLSAGIGRGRVRKVQSPAEAGDLGHGYVLVCPSTDPAWTPLLAGAAALVLERGGTLSHGAIIAREMGVPAVVLDRALAILAEDEEVTVDGSGAVLRSGEEPRPREDTEAMAGEQSHAPRIADLEPPPLGRRERTAGQLTAVGLIGWGVFLLACWTLPASWLWDPCLQILDATLWPLVPALGMAGAMAVIAGILAALSIVGQRLLTDNERLLAVKRRAAIARRHALELPADSVRRSRLECWAHAASGRLFLGAVTPLALALGPMILIFLWCPARLDPASWRPAPGTAIDVVAIVASDVRGPIDLRHGDDIALDALTPSRQLLAPIREMLETLRDAWRAAGTVDALPAHLQVAALRSACGTLEELDETLGADLPPQRLSWRLEPSDLAGGPYEITVSAGTDTLTLTLALGRAHPPAPASTAGPGDALLSLEAIYAPPDRRPVFWRPLAWLGLPWDAGWLGTYLIVYLPLMFLLRRWLRVA